MFNNSASSMNNNNNNATFEEMVPYDSHFVEMLKNLDPSEVTEEFLQAANTALLEQEKHRKKWARQQQHYHHQAAQYSAAHNNTNNPSDTNNQEDILQNHHEQFLSENTNDEFDNNNNSSSSSSASSSSDDDYDTDSKKGQENANSKIGDVATAFAQSFLAPDGAVEHFVRDVRDTAHTLQSLRSTIRRFAKKIDGVTSEVGLLQKKARQTDISLINNHNVKQFTSAASELLVPSLDMVRILANQFSPANTGHNSNFTTLNATNDATAFKTSSELPELGRQYLHSVRMLEKMIQARQSHEINVLQTVLVESINKNNDNSTLSSSSSSSSSRKIHEFVAIPFSEFPNLDVPSHRVIEALARQTCLQVRNFLVPRVAAVLGKPRTNIAMQQRSALMPYRTLVGFLRTCATSPDLLPTKSRKNYFDAANSFVDPHLDSSASSATNLVSPAEAASAFYEELRATYTHFASRVYSTNFTTYIAECLNLQQKINGNGNIVVNNGVNNTSGNNVVLPSKMSQVTNNNSGNNNNQHHYSSSWLDTATSWFSSTPAPTNNSTSTNGNLAINSNNNNNNNSSTTISSSFSFPSLADPSQTLLPTEFSKRIHSLLVSLTTTTTTTSPITSQKTSSSSSQLLNLHKLCSAHPVLPIVQRQQGKFHSPFETFRSVHMLLCDVVTSEFLFTFEFFDGDTNVYDRVFKPVVDTMIQFVMQHFIPSAPPIFPNSSQNNNNNNNKQLQTLVMREKSSISSTDVVGLPILTMMTITFRSQMHLRGLHCLDEYFSDALTLLLPCTKRALEAQYSVIRDELLFLSESSNNSNHVGCGNCGGMELLAKNCAVSPQQLSVILMKNNNNNNISSSGSSKINPASEQLRISLLNKLHPICDRFAHLSFSLRTLFIRMSMEYFISEEDDEEDENINNSSNLESKNPLKSRSSNAKKLSALNGILNSTLGGKNSNNSSNKETKNNHDDNGDFSNDEDDSEDNESITAMCVTFKAMSLDFLEWIKKFARDEICCGKNYSSFLNLPQSQSQQISGTGFNNNNNNNIPIPSAFVINNLGNIFKIWHDLGFGAEINNSSFLQNTENERKENFENNNNVNDDFEKFRQEDRVMDENIEKNSGSNNNNNINNENVLSSCCPLREIIGEIDEEFHNEYESALDEFSYELLKCFMGNVISAIQDAEMTILEIVRSHEEYESDDDDDDEENKNQQKAMIISSVPQQLEEVCVWFRENSADVIVSVSQFCKGTINDKISALPQNSSSTSTSGRCHFREIQVSPREDALKRVFTQLLLWNTRLHTCLGRIFGLIQATMSYQQHVTATMAAQDQKEKNSSSNSNTVLRQDHLAIVNSLSASNANSGNAANPIPISSGTGKHQQKFRSLTVSNIQLTQWIKQQV